MERRAWERIETPRLVLRKPESGDAGSIFWRYSSDPEVTKYSGWPRHRSLADAVAFLEWSEAEWERWPAGPYLIESRRESALLGSSGLAFETDTLAATGYVLAKDAWGKGYATEALKAIVELAWSLGVERLHAVTHPENSASVRVLEKSGFHFEGLLRGSVRFPNSGADELQDGARYAFNRPA